MIFVCSKRTARSALVTIVCSYNWHIILFFFFWDTELSHLGWSKIWNSTTSSRSYWQSASIKSIYTAYETWSFAWVRVFATKRAPFWNRVSNLYYASLSAWKCCKISHTCILHWSTLFPIPTYSDIGNYDFSEEYNTRASLNMAVFSTRLSKFDLCWLKHRRQDAESQASWLTVYVPNIPYLRVYPCVLYRVSLNHVTLHLRVIQIPTKSSPSKYVSKSYRDTAVQFKKKKKWQNPNIYV